MICTITANGSELELKESLRDAAIIKTQKAICCLIADGYTEFYINCEYGAPLWAAEFICSLKKLCL